MMLQLNEQSENNKFTLREKIWPQWLKWMSHGTLKITQIK